MRKAGEIAKRFQKASGKKDKNRENKKIGGKRCLGGAVS